MKQSDREEIRIWKTEFEWKIYLQSQLEEMEDGGFLAVKH